MSAIPSLPSLRPLPAAFPAALLEAVIHPTGQARGLPNAVYTDPAVALIERDRLLGREWTCLGFASSVADRGDARPVSLLGLPLLMLRDVTGEVRVFHNVCRHRGQQLVAEPCHLPGRIRCPYHAWTYGLDGRLRGTPHIGGPGVHEHAGFDRDSHGLHEVRAVEWLGLVFVDLSGDAPPFAARIAPLVARWEALAGAGALERLRPADTDAGFSMSLAANWKLAVENYCESYHLPCVHPSLNTYSRLEDHYGISDPSSFAGQGTRVYDPVYAADSGFPNLPGWDPERIRTAEYVALYPNVLLGIHVDHAFAIVLEPQACDRVAEHVQIYYVGEGASDPAFAPGRRATLEAWRKVFAEDVGVVEGLQRGRASPAFDGGVFSPVMDAPSHHFHTWVAAGLMNGAAAQREEIVECRPT